MFSGDIFIASQIDWNTNSFWMNLRMFHMLKIIDFISFLLSEKTRLAHERIKISQLRRNEAQRKVDVFCGTVETVIHARTARGGAQTAHFPIHAQERLF